MCRTLLGIFRTFEKIIKMKKLLLILILIPFSSFGQYTNIPDANFELVLLNYGYDFVIDGVVETAAIDTLTELYICLLYTSPSPRDYAASRMPSSA